MQVFINHIHMISQWRKMVAYVTQMLWKSVDYDKAYWNQCVDFVRDFSASNYLPIGTFNWSAINGWNSGSPFNSHWQRVFYKPGLVPSEGDIVFFKTTTKNKYGHVAIAWTNSTADSLTIVEQNAGDGNGDGKYADAIQIASTPYRNGIRGDVAGWFTYLK